MPCSLVRHTQVRTSLVVLALLLGVVAAAPAQISDSGATVTRLAEGVYAIIHGPAVNDWPSGAVNWPHGNTGVIVGDNGVLVIDTDFFPSRARADIALIRRLTTKPIRYLVNTHWHGDHTHGNGVYRDLIPDLKILGARDNAEYISINLDRFPKVVTAPGSVVYKGIEALQATIASGKDSSGKALSAAELALARLVVAQSEAEISELAQVKTAPPTVLFDRDTTIDLGGRKVVLKNWGRANSPADVTIYLPTERILFTGDILVHPVPYVFGAYPVPSIAVLAGLERLPVTALVPGHGPVMKDHSYTRLVRGLFEATRDRAIALIRQGKSEAQVTKEIDLSDWRAKFVLSGSADETEVWNESILAGMVGRIYQCVVGYRC